MTFDSMIERDLGRLAEKLGRDPAWVVNRMLHSWFARLYSDVEVWGNDKPRQFFEFADPGIPEDEFGPWLTGIYAQGAEAEKEGVLLRRASVGAATQEQLEWLRDIRHCGPLYEAPDMSDHPVPDEGGFIFDDE